MKFLLLLASVALVASLGFANDKREAYNLVSGSVPAESNQDSINADKLQSISHNVREVRIINGREVEMSENVANKLVVVMDNLSKEASNVWGVVNEKLDQGWTEFKKMVDEAVAPKKP